MDNLNYATVTAFIKPKIVRFHQKRVDSLLSLKLSQVLKRKNPYLFKAKNIHIASDLVKSLMDAHLSLQEEGIFGVFLEELALFVCQKVYGGYKSSTEGIDLEFETKGMRYIVSIKSGPNWGNSSQIAKMRDSFKKAKRILGKNISANNVIAVNGCCYGKDAKPNKGDYLKICGQRFWQFISDDETFYLKIIEPLGYEAKKHTECFEQEYAKVLNKFTLEFSHDFGTKDHAIDWEKLIKFNSQKN